MVLAAASLPSLKTEADLDGLISYLFSYYNAKVKFTDMIIINAKTRCFEKCAFHSRVSVSHPP